jgi:hypothetical protein
MARLSSHHIGSIIVMLYLVTTLVERYQGDWKGCCTTYKNFPAKMLAVEEMLPFGDNLDENRYL